MKIYDWTEIVYTLPNVEFEKGPNDYNVDRLLNMNFYKKNEIPSVLTQFFVFPAVMTENMQTSIPLLNKNGYEKCMSEIAPYFSDVRGYFSLDEKIPFMIKLSEPLEEAKELFLKIFRNNQLHPIVQDLYGSQAHRPFGLINKNIQLKILKDKITSNNVQDDFDEVFEFLKNTFFITRNCLPLIPTYWIYSEELKNSVAIKYFSSRSKGLYLIVDDPTRRVIGMDVYL